MEILPGMAAVLILLWGAGLPATGTAAEPSTKPPVHNIESGQACLRYLQEEEGKIEAWVERNWEKELSKAEPGLSGGGRRRGETETAFKARQMRFRLAASVVKERLRRERAEWIRRERAELLATEIQELIPARLGPLDAGRGDYPLFLGFGWPAGKGLTRCARRRWTRRRRSAPRALRSGNGWWHSSAPWRGRGGW